MVAKKLSNPVVAVVGATGAVGVELIRCLEQRKFPLSELRLFASARSAGKTLDFRGKPLPVRELTDESFAGVHIGLFSAGSATTKKFAKPALDAGTIIVDNSSAYRMDPAVPLVVPEINAQTIATHKGIIANPNCSAIISITPLWPIHRKNRIKRMIISTYQAASGAGAAAMEELRESTRAYLDGKKFTPKVLPHPYAFNAFSHNTKVDPGDAAQRRRDQGHQRDAEDLRRSEHRDRRHVHPDPRAARALRVGHIRVREADFAGRGARNPFHGAGREGRRRRRAQLLPDAGRRIGKGRHSSGSDPSRSQ